MLIKTNSLSPETLRVIRDKGTEKPLTGEYNDFDEPGTYLCRQCGLALFRAQAKFHSGCGWPSFDEEIPGNVIQIQDADGMRRELLCARCDAHLGHVFRGEGYTNKNTRHCINSVSLDFVSDQTVNDSEEAIFAAGCFWGVEHYFKKLAGVLKTEVGYSGGHKKNPTYQEVCAGATQHFEVIRVVYDPTKIDFRSLTKYFFEIHDPTQQNGQGPDIGSQYLSVVFYYNEAQNAIATDLIAELKRNHYAIATQVLPVNIFWPAEEYHQDYYRKTQKSPYCHHYVKRF